MSVGSLIVAAITMILILLGGSLLLTPIVFSGRVIPGIKAVQHDLTGVNTDELPAIITTLEQEIARQPVTLTLRDQTQTYQLSQLGVTLNHDATRQAITRKNIFALFTNQATIHPVANINEDVLVKQLDQDFAAIISSPQNATLQFNSAGDLFLVPSQPGEVVVTNELKSALQSVVANAAWSTNIPLSLQTSEASVQDNETAAALDFARQLLAEGIELTFSEQVFVMKPFTIRRLIEFVPQVDSTNFNNKILGIKLNPAALSDYLTTTIVPEIDQIAQNARFVLSADGRVEQFALPQPGQELDLTATAASIAAKLAKHERIVPLVVTVTEPTISALTDIKQLGITTKLSTGESDFVGSPKNRQHNITLGAARYHGLLIAPGAEFSFNEFLGPVDAAAGFKPELVIKENVTTPEFGGGLCQVSTTLFRSALYAGLEITQRHNHSYAVSYYGKPGLDATIYPPYTDLRFLNNTPGYILIQSRIEGTKLAFDFWGTNDNRTVTITGPVSYDHGTDGSVKAYVSQQVTLANESIIDETFYSRYKSPKLFPKVLGTETSPSPSTIVSPPAPAQAPTPTPSTKPIKSPLPSNEPKTTSPSPTKTTTDG